MSTLPWVSKVRWVGVSKRLGELSWGYKDQYGEICGPLAHTCLHVQMCPLTQVAHGRSDTNVREARGSREEASECVHVHHVHTVVLEPRRRSRILWVESGSY